MNIIKRKTLIAVTSCLIVLFICCGCGSQREYNEDIHIQLETRQAEVIIKEWSFLLGSGSEVYYKDNDKEVLLGKLVGGDDGFCPFKEGLYSVVVDDDALTIEWPEFPNSERSAWETKSFELPED